MQALILAAGRGSRLGAFGADRPKCLLEVGGAALIEHQLEALRAIGVRRVAVVVGHRAGDVRSALGNGVTYVENRAFAATNSLYSLWLARCWIEGSFLLLNSDLLCAREIYRRVARARGTALAFDGGSGQDAEHMKVAFRRGRLAAIGKDLPAARAQGENVGVLRFGPAAARVLLAVADAIVQSGRRGDWAPAAVDRLARLMPIRGIDVAGLPWIEIDFPTDVVAARDRVWPAILAGGRAPVPEIEVSHEDTRVVHGLRPRPLRLLPAAV
jgi:choline kinase